jgi:hypothetical protein
MMPEEPFFSCLETAWMIGRKKGAKRPRMKAVSVSLIWSRSFSRPGTLAIPRLMVYKE